MSNLTKQVTFAHLERVLTGLAFAHEQPHATYQLFMHTNPEILLVLPIWHPDDQVDSAHLVAVRTQIVENGLLDAAAFDRLLEGNESTVASS